MNFLMPFEIATVRRNPDVPILASRWDLFSIAGYLPVHVQGRGARRVNSVGFVGKNAALDYVWA